MQTRRHFVATLSALSLVGLSRPLSADTPAPSEADAEAAARAWLDLVDAGRYPESWDEAAPVFQAAITKPQWAQALAAVRQPLGRCLSRAVRTRKTVESRPNGPKGPYVVIEIAARFEAKPEAVETVTPALGADGRWRVAGYFIR
jgi:hypothetical protein